jgi:hypothetical protein
MFEHTRPRREPGPFFVLAAPPTNRTELCRYDSSRSRMPACPCDLCFPTARAKEPVTCDPGRSVPKTAGVVPLPPY